MTNRIPPSLPASDSAACASSCPSSSSSLSASCSSDEEPLSSHRKKDVGQPRFASWISQSTIPFSSLGSFRPCNGDSYKESVPASSSVKLSLRRARSGISPGEAPAKLPGQFPLASPLEPQKSFYCSLQRCSEASQSNKDASLESASRAVPIYTSHDKPPLSEHMISYLRLQRQHYQQIGRSFSTDLDREEAWERKKELYLSEEDGIETDADVDSDVGYDSSGCEEEHGQTFIDDDAASDPGGTGNSAPGFRKKVSSRPRNKPFSRTKTRSLTDEDMEELRGSIDLGFGFSHDESSNLKNTLPALELYYAVNKQYLDAKSRSTPGSPHQGTSLLPRTVSADSTGSTASPLSESWHISSPGDNPNQVKTRLRHWAQAVACSIKQGF